MKVKIKGFTLIELLIVVAIIAILAAIAIPNFLAAQIRSKVARAQADMASVGVAIESYSIDNNCYPWPPNPNGWNVANSGDWNNNTWLGIPLCLSTPVSYISNAILWDPFSRSDDRKSYGFQNDNIIQYYPGQFVPWYTSVGHYYGCYALGEDAGDHSMDNDNKHWVIWSAGPEFAVYWSEGWICYDPTNGTFSIGNIDRFGP